MPPWVARQWQVLRCPHSAAGISCRPQTLPRHYPRSTSTLRSYAQTPHRDDKKLEIGRANSAIIIPSSVANTQPSDLIKHIQPVDKARLTRDRFAVFFVTPSFSPWLLDDGAFLHKALTRAYQRMLDWDRFPYARVHALCAVVDKLPVPTPLGHVENLEDDVLNRMAQPPVSETGFEGLAYATLRFSDSIPSSSSLGEGKAAITFVASQGSESGGYFGDTIRLPLANTVFQTGSPTTMTYSTWEKTKGNNDLTLKSKHDVTHHGIKMGAAKQLTSSLAIPLVPLTFPRRVEGSMGNILRRVIGPDGKSVTASQELERIVPRYFSTRGEPSQATSVWALVMPKHLVDPILQKTNLLLGTLPDEDGVDVSSNEEDRWEGLWKRDPPLWNELVPTALSSGARLHRVLSGGGGWGKKAGLLSLDPVATSEDAASSFASMFDEPKELSSALQQVAHDGDYIQFFISPSTALPEPKSSESLSGMPETSVESSKPWGWELGTIPSTADLLPGGSWQHDPAGSNTAHVFRHSFGALAEGGMTINRQFKLKSKDTFSLIGGSKVDVPFSRFSAVTTGAMDEGMEDDSIQNCLRSTSVPYHSVLFRRLYGDEAPPLLGLERLDILSQGQRNVPSAGIQEQDLKITPIRKVITKSHGPVQLVSSINSPAERALKFIHNNRASENVNPLHFAPHRVQRNEVKHCFNKLCRTQRVVERLTDQYRRLMHSIRQRNSLPMDSAVRRRVGTQATTQEKTKQNTKIRRFFATTRIRAHISFPPAPHRKRRARRRFSRARHIASWAQVSPTVRAVLSNRRSREYISRERAWRIYNEKATKKKQLERKKKARAVLVDTVRGWLSGGGG